eukprot:2750156-Pleurochrysis_carterae.AAC.3
MRRRGRVAAFVRGVAHAKGRAYAHSAAPQTAVRSCSQPCTAIHNRWGGGESMRPADERPWLAEGTPPLPPPLASLPKASLLGGPCRVAPNCGCDPKPSETGCAHACGDACAHACGGGPKPAPSDGGGCGNAAATDGGIKAVTLGSLEATTNSNIWKRVARERQRALTEQKCVSEIKSSSQLQIKVRPRQSHSQLHLAAPARALPWRWMGASVPDGRTRALVAPSPSAPACPERERPAQRVGDSHLKRHKEA